MLDRFWAAVPFGSAPFQLHKYELDDRSYLCDCRIISRLLEKVAQPIWHVGRCADGDGVFWSREFVLVWHITAFFRFIKYILQAKSRSKAGNREKLCKIG